ncbi:MAG: N-acetylneuraminate synthase [Rhodospirillaceae bacterium]|nr:N-acetylneuraminate synthase [Rhodospirillaceae bacterium]|tara:strand:- start:865 stop:1884 length:1020 start_codon:yes stop_codon:yes gene_type:complete
MLENNKCKFYLNRKKTISVFSPCYIIAEIGINHEGDVNKAIVLTKEAFKAGADAVKFQIVDPDLSYEEKSISYKLFKKSLLKANEYENLLKKFIHKGDIFATPGDLKSLDLCEKLNINFYKISSGLLTNLPLIKEIKKTGKSIILSTGMASIEEIKTVVKNIQNKRKNNLAILHCVSVYPAAIGETNLNSIRYLNRKFNVITGYSDHVLNYKASLLAVAAGAKIIEKHFTLDNKARGFDHKISLDPKEFKNMVTEIRKIEKILGKNNKEPTKKELNKKLSLQRFCVASEKIKKGTKFDLNNIAFKRIINNKDAIRAFDYKKIINKKSNKTFNRGQIIKV